MSPFRALFGVLGYRTGGASGHPFASSGTGTSSSPQDPSSYSDGTKMDVNLHS
jgi:hypothetical protein